jgi:hypothetical protein
MLQSTVVLLDGNGVNLRIEGVIIGPAEFKGLLI